MKLRLDDSYITDLVSDSLFLSDNRFDIERNSATGEIRIQRCAPSSLKYGSIQSFRGIMADVDGLYLDIAE